LLYLICRDSIHDKLILNKANVFNILAKRPGLSYFGVIKNTPKYDNPGLLASILNTFALFNINLSWIESRPLKTKLGQYHFLLEQKSDIGRA
jgi:prephenate dehydratase